MHQLCSCCLLNYFGLRPYVDTAECHAGCIAQKIESAIKEKNLTPEEEQKAREMAFKISQANKEKPTSDTCRGNGFCELGREFFNK
jgi:hypothetical protein